jgi:uncharacterized protein (AIM24 family)
MIKINNFFTNPNVKVIAQKGNYYVMEYQRKNTNNVALATPLYFAYQMKIREKQVGIELKNSSAILSSGAMQWTAGNVEAETNVKGVGDLFGKAIKGSVTGESAIKPIYRGTGWVFLEPTFNHILLEDVEEWAGGMVLQDGLFLAADGNVEHSVVRRTNLTSALAGGEGLFNLCLKGKGVAVLESPVPREDLIEVVLENDTLKVDGNFAVAWSNSLEFTVERSGKSLIGSAAGGEGLVNVYRGTGKVLLIPVK